MTLQPRVLVSYIFYKTQGITVCHRYHLQRDIISATCLFHQFTHVGSYIMFQGGSRTSQDIPPYVIAGKEPVRYAGVNLIGLRRRGFSNEVIEAIHDTYRIIYAQGVLKDGIAEARAKYPDMKEVEYICSFIESSKRGVIR